jgi:hypothetical protein
MTTRVAATKKAGHGVASSQPSIVTTVRAIGVYWPRWAAVLFGLTIPLALITCGCGSDRRIVAWVGPTPITAREVAHRANVLQAEHLESARTARRRALEQIISDDWVAGELAHEKLKLARGAVQSRLQSNQAKAFPGGAEESRAYLAALDETRSDLRHEAEVELATDMLRRRVLAAVAAPTTRDLSRYYTRHMNRFIVTEVRTIQITNRKHAAETLRLRRAVERGGSFRARSETWTLRRPARAVQPLERSIYAAPAKTLIGPVKQRVDYFLFEVKKVIPARYRSLSSVKPWITARLADERREKALAMFVRAWRVRWREKTSCRGGYVVPKCREYRGARPRENPTAFT